VNEERKFLQTSIYLTAEDQQVLTSLQERTGMNRSELVRHAVARMYNGEEDTPAARRTRLIEIAEEIKRLA
jgi:predicted DNA-binding protein